MLFGVFYVQVLPLFRISLWLLKRSDTNSSSSGGLHLFLFWLNLMQLAEWEYLLIDFNLKGPKNCLMTKIDVFIHDFCLRLSTHIFKSQQSYYSISEKFLRKGFNKKGGKYDHFPFLSLWGILKTYKGFWAAKKSPLSVTSDLLWSHYII